MTETWLTQTTFAPLADGEVHLWRAPLAQMPATLERLHATLAPDETAKAARYRFQRHRDHYVAARGILRQLLGRYLDAPPERLRFTYSPYGKPALDPSTHGEPDLCFNLSHSHELALYAFARGRELGIDIEHVRADLAGAEIAARFFSAREVSALRALPTEETRVRAFFNCWTRKEAYIKARGEGLSHPLDAFDVSLAPGDPAALLGTRGDPQELTRWTLHGLDAGEDYAAALAVRGSNHTLCLWQWPPL
ncbi:MAG TPA: 4'-phosphopantetheinyl transferase superfamily protein [Pyrinomonadaceae bacterium]|nr:4'-phosphopantetheinyl transferase superfamily protein [Pyrinomonadaceae bacterium]